MNKKIFTGVDFFKCMAALGVVAIHTRAPIFNVFGRLGVPFFAIISGMFFFSKYTYLDSKDKKKKYLFKYLKRIFLLYLTWQVIYIPFVIKNILYYKENNYDLITFIWRFIFPGYGYSTSNHFIAGTNGWGVSWYLIALLMGLPLLCLLLKYINNMMFIGIISIGIEILYILNSGYFYITHFHIWGILAFPRIFIYLFIGLVISRNLNLIEQINIYKLIVILIIFMSLFFAENYFIYLHSGNIVSEEVITTVPTSTLVVLLSLKLNLNVDTLTLREFSIFLYTSQILFIFVLQHTIFKNNYVLTNYLEFFIVVLLAYLAMKLCFSLKDKFNIVVLNFKNKLATKLK